MASTVYSFNRDVSPEDWKAIPREFKAGETVTRFTGYTYGLERDDMRYLDTETIAVVADGSEAFFTCPVALLVDESGKGPWGSYRKFQPANK